MHANKLRGKRRGFASRLAGMKAEAGALGLYRTLHALDNATSTVGWEITDLETGKQVDTIRQDGKAR